MTKRCSIAAAIALSLASVVAAQTVFLNCASFPCGGWFVGWDLPGVDLSQLDGYRVYIDDVLVGTATPSSATSAGPFIFSASGDHVLEVRSFKGDQESPRGGNGLGFNPGNGPTTPGGGGAPLPIVLNLRLTQPALTSAPFVDRAGNRWTLTIDGSVMCAPKGTDPTNPGTRRGGPASQLALSPSGAIIAFVAPDWWQNAGSPNGAESGTCAIAWTNLGPQTPK